MVQWSQGYPTFKSISRRWRTCNVGYRPTVILEFIVFHILRIVVATVVIMVGDITALASSVRADFFEENARSLYGSERKIIDPSRSTTDR